MIDQFVILFGLKMRILRAEKSIVITLVALSWLLFFVIVLSITDAIET